MPRIYPSEAKERARQLRKDGLELQEIALQVKAPEGTIRSWVAGIVPGKRKRPANATPAPWATGYRWTGTKWR